MSTTAPPSHRQHALVAQEPLFAPEAAAVAGELCGAAAADDAVERHDDGDRIAAVSGADGAHGLGVVDGCWDGTQIEDVAGHSGADGGNWDD